MGYRSEVALVLSKEACDAFKKARQKASKAVKMDLEMLFRSSKCYTYTNGDYLLYWAWIKWYSEFLSIGFIEDFLKTINTDTYLLAIIGEELDDIMYKGSNYSNPFDMSISRAITFKNSNNNKEIYKISSTP